MSAEDVFQSSWLVGALVLVVTSVWLTLWAARRLGRRAHRRRAARAQRAERGAAALLEARGFEVLGRQVRKSWAVISEGGEVRFDLVADYLVKMRGQRWVAEVKTGERALDLRHGPTRRQLLEYREAFAVEGVLLVDAEGQTLRRVHFPRAGTGRRSTAMATFIAGLATGLALAAYWFSSV